MPDDADALREAFERKGQEVTTSIEKGVLAACLLVEAEARKNAPVDTGNLRGSITHRVSNDDGAVFGEVGTSIEHGPPQEFGTAKMQAANNGRGFLTPALNENKATIAKIIADAVKEQFNG